MNNEPVLELGRLTAGDRVGIRESGYDSYSKATVTRTTATQIVVLADGAAMPRKFRISDGREVGRPYGSNLVHPHDPHLLAYAVRKAFETFASGVDRQWRELRNDRSQGRAPEPVRILELMRKLSLELTTAEQKAAALLRRLPPPADVKLIRLSCTDCARETTDLTTYTVGSWCKQLPDSIGDCPGFLIGVRA
jgi:hypothetical protein